MCATVHDMDGLPFGADAWIAALEGFVRLLEADGDLLERFLGQCALHETFRAVHRFQS
jgi:hypothetical protein